MPEPSETIEGPDAALRDEAGQPDGSENVGAGEASPAIQEDADSSSADLADAEEAIAAGMQQTVRREQRESGTEQRKTIKLPEGVKHMNIVFVASECSPYSKSGGLADVMGSLPLALAARGHRVMVITPRYDDYSAALDTGHRINVHGAEVGYFHEMRGGVDWVFLDHPSYRRPGGLYGDAFGDYDDNQWRFKLMCLAALEAPLQLEIPGGKYGEDCVFVANDWHAGLVPVYLAGHYRRHGTYASARSIFAIHNLR